MPIPSYTALGIPDDPLIDTWQIDEPFRKPNSTDMDGGNIRMRTRPGDQIAQISFGVMMTLAQFNTFKTFANTTLGRGASRFTMRIWNGSAMVSKTVQLVEGIYTQKPIPPHKVTVGFTVKVYEGL